MSTRFKYLIIIFVGTLLVQCSRSPKCWGDDENKGIIEEELQIFCNLTEFSLQNTFVIDNDSDYVRKFTAGCSLPPIDFSKHTLLGSFADGACNVKYVRKVEKKESEQRYDYSIVVKECGLCKSHTSSFNWVLVPKLPQGWTVDFKVKNK